MKQDVRHLTTFQVLPSAYVAMEKKLFAEAKIDKSINTTVTGKIGAEASRHAIQYNKDIRGMCQHFMVQSILDYGGTGTSWDDIVSEPHITTLTETLGARAYQNFDLLGDTPAPDNADAIICCDVLEHIYVGDVGIVIDDMFARANKMVYVVVECFSAKEKYVNGDNVHVTMRSPDWWRGVFDATAMRYPEIAYRLICYRAIDNMIAYSVRRFAGISGSQMEIPESFKRIAVESEYRISIQRAIKYTKEHKWALAGLSARKVNPLELNEQELMQYLTLLGSLLRFGHVSATLARKINRLAPPDKYSHMRYFIALVTRDWKLAKSLRMAAKKDPETLRGIRAKASMAMLHHGKRRLGLKFYHSRDRAVNFVKENSHPIKYVPFKGELTADAIALEQGVGDRMLHLGHIKSYLDGRPALFYVAPSWASIIKKFIPNSTIGELSPDEGIPQGKQIHLSSEFLVHQYLKTGTTAPQLLLAPQLKTPSGFGFSWRGGAQTINEPETRVLDLELMLSVLPRDERIICLQYDVSRSEREFIKGICPNIEFPFFDLKRDRLKFVQLIQSLEGIISIRNANIMTAAVCGVPSLCFIDAATFWVWFDDRENPKQMYPGMCIQPRSEISPMRVEQWVDSLRGLKPRMRPVGGFRRC